MDLLIVAATALEAVGAGIIPEGTAVEPGVAKSLKIGAFTANLLVTGVGAVPTAYELGRHLAGTQYRMALNIGIAGSFDVQFEPGTAVWVQNDCFGDVGAETSFGFLSLFELGLAGISNFPFTNGVLEAEIPQDWKLPDVPAVRGVSVNKVQGRAITISEFLAVYPEAGIETMEGASFYYACRKADQPCIQIRAISNFVEPRNREAWKIREALEALKDAVHGWLIANSPV